MRVSDPQREAVIVSMYQTGMFQTQHIARTFGISTRRVTQIAKKHGVVRTQAEANRLAAGLKSKHRSIRLERQTLSLPSRHGLPS